MFFYPVSSVASTKLCLYLLFPQQRPSEGQENEHLSSGWRGFLSNIGLSVPAGLCRLAPSALHLGQHRMLQGKAPEIPDHVLRLAGVGPHKLRAEWSLPGFITMFLPEFPHRTVPGHEHFQVRVILNASATSCVLWLNKAFSCSAFTFFFLTRHHPIVSVSALFSPH